MNYREIYASLVKNTKKYFKKAKKTKAVIGLSGGLDSSLCAAIVADAIGKKNLTALILPEQGVTSTKDVNDAIEFAKRLKIKFLVYPINHFLPAKFPWKQKKIAVANMKARIRMLILYNYANSNNALVVGTSNRSEFLLGYFTKYGDGAADVLPIASLYKTDLKKLAVWLGIPKKITNKKPSAGLWAGQTDEKELGASYEKIDKLLKMIFDEHKTKREILKSGFSKKFVDKIFRRILSTAHKRSLPTQIPLC